MVGQHVNNALATHWQCVGNMLATSTTRSIVAQRCQLVETVHQIRRVCLMSTDLWPGVYIFPFLPGGGKRMQVKTDGDKNGGKVQGRKIKGKKKKKGKRKRKKQREMIEGGIGISFFSLQGQKIRIGSKKNKKALVFKDKRKLIMRI